MIGTSLSHYQITAVLGAGGMGEVWRAEDTTLEREVALKILPEDFANDQDRRARFEREAKILASLNHPNIATLFGLENLEGRHVLVMELVEGEGLDEMVARGPISGPEAFPIALQIAEALEAAHDNGVVHRDLKPANIRIRPDGTVKVLDFGLAKAWESEAEGGLSLSPTLTSHNTEAGVILGTASYMSPEQARGKPVGKSADIWAFGVVVWEMLTGRKLFPGDTVSDVMAAVLRAEIDPGELPLDTPVAIRQLLRRCLERNTKNRIHDIADARIVIEELMDGRLENVSAEVVFGREPVTSRRLLSWSLIFTMGCLAGLVALWAIQPFSHDPEEAPSHPTFRQLTFLAGGEEMPAMAPDGESFVYVKQIDGQRDIFLQRVSGSNAINLTSGCAEDDREPAFSADGKKIAYRSECAGGGVFIMGTLGESPRKVTDKGYNPTWSPDGLELAVADEQLGLPFGRTTNSQIWAVHIETGERRILSERDAVEPSWSPDGRRVAFWGLRSDDAARDLWTVAADGSQAAIDAAVPVTDDWPVDWSPIWSPDSRALFFASTRGGTMNLWRIAVDPDSGRPLGESQPVTAPSSWVGFPSASADGRRIAFVDRNVRSTIQVADLDPRGPIVIGSPQSVPLGTLEVHEQISLAQGGDRVLFSSSGLPQHLFMATLAGDLRQMTDGPHRDRQAVFSPDDILITFQTDRWPTRLAMLKSDGGGLRELATGWTTSAWYPLWSRDGRWLAAGSDRGAFVLEMSAGFVSGSPVLLPSPGEDLSFWPSSWSPDGRTLAGSLVSSAKKPHGAALYDVAEQAFDFVEIEGISRLHFLPDGQRLIIAKAHSLEVHDLETKTTRLLISAGEGATILGSDLTFDGRRLGWHEQKDESDIWLASFGEGQ